MNHDCLIGGLQVSTSIQKDGCHFWISARRGEVQRRIQFLGTNLIASSNHFQNLILGIDVCSFAQ
jgi:hypothetical protein